jgi:hypothetical protein
MRLVSKRYLVGALVGLVAVAAVACGGDSDDDDAPAPAAGVVPTAVPQVQTPAPAAALPTPAAPTGVASVAPAATASPSAAQLPAPEEGAFGWAIEDVDEGTKPALALTGAGVPNIAYMLEAQDGFVKNAVRAGSSWDIDILATGYFYGPLDIATGPDDVVHVTYHDHQDSGFDPAKGDAVYAVLRDGTWTVDAVFDDGHDGWDNRITVDAQGRPHMSAVDPEEFGGDGVEYYSQDDSGQWTVEAVGSGSLTYKYATSVAVDPEGGPHITYYDQKNNDLAFASRDGSGWDIALIDTEGDTGLFSSLVIGQDGSYHVSYLRKTGGSAGVVKYATRPAGGGDWTIREVDTLDDLLFEFTGARNITSLVLDSSGNPWIAYSDEGTLRLAVWDGSQWKIDTVVDAGSRPLGQLVSLKLDGQDQPHVAYFEVTSTGGPLAGVIKYAKGTPTS